MSTSSVLGITIFCLLIVGLCGMEMRLCKVQHDLNVRLENGVERG